MWSHEVHMFIKQRVAGKRKNGSDNDDKNTLITIMSKVNGGTTEPTVNNNRGYSPTVLHKVMAWCLSLG